ncbi:MAG: hypothetical protein FWD27_01815 [Coriobacteriia bacterium]|nr:hypothetical protein [Coriobacteriia bacterium]
MALREKGKPLVRRTASQPPRSRAFLLELLLNMFVFSLCAAIALQIFVHGKLATDESAALSHLMLEAKDLAGHYKVSNGELGELAQNEDRAAYAYLEDDGKLVYYYDKNLQLCESYDGRYRLELSLEPNVASGTASSAAPGAGSSAITSATPSMGSSAGGSVTIIHIAAHAPDEELFSVKVAHYLPRTAQGQEGSD